MYKAWNNSVSKVLSTNTCFCWCTICPRSNAIGLSLDSYFKKTVKWIVTRSYDRLFGKTWWSSSGGPELIDWWCKQILRPLQWWTLLQTTIFRIFQVPCWVKRILFDGSTWWINCRQRWIWLGKTWFHTNATVTRCDKSRTAMYSIHISHIVNICHMLSLDYT